jgi:hypothetical protein
MRFPISFFVYIRPRTGSTEYAKMELKHDEYRNDFTFGLNQVNPFLVSCRFLWQNYSKEYSCRNTTLQ